jgi:hypothetical protein
MDFRHHCWPDPVATGLGNDAATVISLALEEAADCSRRPLGTWNALGD